MKKYIHILILVITLNSCHAQVRIDLEQFDFKSNATQLFTNMKSFYDNSYPGTTLPRIYTYNVGHFKFGPIELIENEDDNVVVDAGVFINNKKEIEGLIINIGYTKQSLQLLQYLISKYNKPIILAPLPTKNNNGQLLGRASYLWKDVNNNRAMLLSHSYKYFNKKNNISSVLYIIDNEIKVINSNDNRTVLQYLIDVYKE